MTKPRLPWFYRPRTYALGVAVMSGVLLHAYGLGAWLTGGALGAFACLVGFFTAASVAPEAMRRVVDRGRA